MARLKGFRYIAMRQQPDGSIRPRFQPGPRERALGFQNLDLRHDDGRWFSLDEVRAWSDARHAEILRVRASGRKLRMPAAVRARTVEDLLEAFLNSGRFRRPREDGGYPPKTRDDYRKKANVIIFKPQSAEDRREGREKEREPFALSPARTLTPGAIANDEDGGFFGYLKRTRGLATARGAIMVLSAAYKWQRKAEGWGFDVNPCTRLRLQSPQPNPIVFTIEEFDAIRLYGDHPAIDEIDVVDVCYLALFSGQRPGDVRAYDGAGTSEGVTRLVQSKRGKRVVITQLPPLTQRLREMADERAWRGFTCNDLMVDHHTGKGWRESTLQHRFKALRDMIVKGRPDLDLPAVPSIAGKQLKHLRKTLLTWLKRYGKVSDNEFAAVSGHALASLPQVMPHYYEPGADEADAAMTKVWVWMQTKGMAG